MSDETIRAEMSTYRSILKYANTHKYIDKSKVSGKLPIANAQRDEFIEIECEKLIDYLKKWKDRGKSKDATWTRTMIYYFVLIMLETDIRTIEAKNLKWRDVSLFTEGSGKKVVHISLWGKKKYRKIPAKIDMWTYLQEIRDISKSIDDDYIFSNYSGNRVRRFMVKQFVKF